MSNRHSQYPVYIPNVQSTFPMSSLHSKMSSPPSNVQSTCPMSSRHSQCPENHEHPKSRMAQFSFFPGDSCIVVFQVIQYTQYFFDFWIFFNFEMDLIGLWWICKSFWWAVIWLWMCIFVWPRISVIIWLRMSHLYDYACRSHVTANVAVGWLCVSVRSFVDDIRHTGREQQSDIATEMRDTAVLLAHRLKEITCNVSTTSVCFSNKKVLKENMVNKN